MKKCKLELFSIFLLVLFAMLSFSSVEAADMYHPFRTDLIAGGGNGHGTDVGDIYVWNNDFEYLYVEIITTGGWVISTSQVAVGTMLSEIPQKNGNPPPGQFPYKMNHNPGVTDYTYKIAMKPQWQGTLYIAVHTDVLIGGLAGLESALPISGVAVINCQPYIGGPTYFPSLTVSDDGFLNGTYVGWCADCQRTIMVGTRYPVLIFSSYEPLPSGAMEYPANLNLVNWLLNQNFVYKPSPSGYGLYTYGDVQLAIWKLLWSNPTPSALGPYDIRRVNEIISLAMVNGQGFVPQPGQDVAILLVPWSKGIIISQTIIIQWKVPYGGSETAWGFGDNFPGKNWAMSFRYKVD